MEGGPGGWAKYTMARKVTILALSLFSLHVTDERVGVEPIEHGAKSLGFSQYLFYDSEETYL